MRILFIVLIVVNVTAVLDDEAVPVDGRVGAGRQRVLPEFVHRRVAAEGDAGGDLGHVIDVFLIDTVIPDAHPGGGQVAVGGAQPQPDGRAGGHGPAGAAEEHVAAVVAQLGPVDVVIVAGRAGHEDRSDQQSQ